MIGYYRFDGNVYDEISRTNASATNVAYEYDYIKFSGASSHLELNEANSIRNANAATVSLWLYMEDYPLTAYNPYIETYPYQNNTKMGIYIYNKKLSLVCTNTITGDGDTAISLGTDVEFPLQSWHFLCGVCDFENGIMKLYLDNECIGQKSIEYPCSFTNSSNIRYVSHVNSVSSNYSINICVDELTIWKRALTDDEVNKLYRMRIDNKVLMMPTQNLAFYASLNGKTPNVAETGQSITTSCNFIQKSGIKCGSFENNENMVLIPSSYSILGNSLPYTISFWYYLESEKTNYAYGFLYTIYDSSGNDNDKLAFMIRPHMNGITVGGRMYNDVNAPQNIIEYDKWIHFVSVIYSNKVELYFNNVKYELSRNQNFYNQQIYFGYAPYTDYNRSGINGCISSIRIYNKALTGREISILSKEFKKFNKNAIPEEGLIFYDSLKTNVNVCETGQARSGSATSYNQVVSDIPCTYFNGNNQWIYYPGFVLQDNQSYSISIWVNKVGNVGSNENGFCSLSSSSIRKRISISENGDRLIQVYANSIGVTTEGSIIKDSQSMVVGNWYHFVCVVDVSNKRISYYKNGNLIETDVYEHWNNGSGYEGTSGFVIGNLCSWIGYENDYRTNSYISSVRVYNRVLTQDEITKLSNEF